VPFWTRWWRVSPQPPPGTEPWNSDRPNRSLVAIPTELSQLLFETHKGQKMFQFSRHKPLLVLSQVANDTWHPLIISVDKLTIPGACSSSFDTPTVYLLTHRKCFTASLWLSDSHRWCPQRMNTVSRMYVLVITRRATESFIAAIVAIVTGQLRRIHIVAKTILRLFHLSSLQLSSW
jgi:hypothetical protein